MDEFLRQTRFNDSSAYTKCREMPRSAVRELLEQAEATMARDEEQYKQTRKVHDQKLEAIGAADSIFSFFMPPSTEGTIVFKFWGAMHEMLKVIWHRAQSRPS